MTEKDIADSAEETARKPARKRKTAAVQEARASPQTKDNKTQEILKKAMAEPKPDWQVAEQVVLIPLELLKPFKNHPFKVRDDDELMQDTIDSIMAGGVINPILVRPTEDGRFEVVSGHRRFRASELAGKANIKAIVREMDDDTAVITMVDSNIQRENLLPSERAQAYKMKMEALRHQGQRSDLTSSQVGTKLRADEILAKDSGTSRSQVQRYIRLASLTPKLMEMVDNKELAFNPAVELSYLKPEEQTDFLSAIQRGHILLGAHHQFLLHAGLTVSSVLAAAAAGQQAQRHHESQTQRHKLFDGSFHAVSSLYFGLSYFTFH